MIQPAPEDTYRREPPRPPFRPGRPEADEHFFARQRMRLADVRPASLPMLFLVPTGARASELVEIGVAAVADAESLRRALRRLDVAVLVVGAEALGVGTWCSGYVGRVVKVDPAAVARLKTRRQAVDLAQAVL